MKENRSQRLKAIASILFTLGLGLALASFWAILHLINSLILKNVSWGLPAFHSINIALVVICAFVAKEKTFGTLESWAFILMELVVSLEVVSRTQSIIGHPSPVADFLGTIVSIFLICCYAFTASGIKDIVFGNPSVDPTQVKVNETE